MAKGKSREEKKKRRFLPFLPQEGGRGPPAAGETKLGTGRTAPCRARGRHHGARPGAAMGTAGGGTGRQRGGWGPAPVPVPVPEPASLLPRWPLNTCGAMALGAGGRSGKPSGKIKKCSRTQCLIVNSLIRVRGFTCAEAGRKLVFRRRGQRAGSRGPAAEGRRCPSARPGCQTAAPITEHSLKHNKHRFQLCLTC